MKEKLSIAIREGSKRHPQTRGILIEQDGPGIISGTCALGAAAVTLLGETVIWADSQRQILEALREAFPVLGKYVEIPGELRNAHDRLYSKPECSVETLINRANDRHGWSRERIAEWVATIE